MAKAKRTPTKQLLDELIEAQEVVFSNNDALFWRIDAVLEKIHMAGGFAPIYSKQKNKVSYVEIHDGVYEFYKMNIGKQECVGIGYYTFKKVKNLFCLENYMEHYRDKETYDDDVAWNNFFIPLSLVDNPTPSNLKKFVEQQKSGKKGAK